MDIPRGDDPHGSSLSETVVRQLRGELAALRSQRDRLRGDDVAEDHRASNSGDRAEALRRADDVFRVEDRIREIQRLLTVGAPGRVAGGKAPALAEGSIITLRFPDGGEETFYASSILATAPGGHPGRTSRPVQPAGPSARRSSHRRHGQLV
jgi:hypothetical protein